MAKGGHYLHEPHAIIGMILLGTLFFMPILGTFHHKAHKKVQKRTVWSYGHIFSGRAIIILGMINGGLGLRLAGASKTTKIVYGVFAGLMGVAYLATIVFGELNRSRQPAPSAAASSSAHREPKRDASGSDSAS